MSFVVKIHGEGSQKIIVVTDSELIGKTFSEGELQLDLNKEFYKGEEKNEEETIKLFQDAHILHLTGEKAVKLGHKEGLVEKVITVDRIPHAEVYFES